MLNFSQVAVPPAFPPAMYESSICSMYMFSEESCTKVNCLSIKFND